MISIGKIKELSSYTDSIEILKLVVDLEDDSIQDIINFYKLIESKKFIDYKSDIFQENYNYLIKQYINQNKSDVIKELIHYLPSVNDITSYTYEFIDLLIDACKTEKAKELIFNSDFMKYYSPTFQGKILKIFLKSCYFVRNIIIACVKESMPFDSIESIAKYINDNHYAILFIKKYDSENSEIDYFKLYEILNVLKNSKAIKTLYCNDILSSKLSLTKISEIIEYYCDSKLNLDCVDNCNTFLNILKILYDKNDDIIISDDNREFYLLAKIILECNINNSEVCMKDILDLLKFADECNAPLLISELQDGVSKDDIFTIEVELKATQENPHLMDLFVNEKIRKNLDIIQILRLINDYKLNNNKAKIKTFIQIVDSIKESEIDTNFYNKLVQKLNSYEYQVSVNDYLNYCESINDFIQNLSDYDDNYVIDPNSKLSFKYIF